MGKRERTHGIMYLVASVKPLMCSRQLVSLMKPFFMTCIFPRSHLKCLNVLPMLASSVNSSSIRLLPNLVSFVVLRTMTALLSEHNSKRFCTRIFSRVNLQSSGLVNLLLDQLNLSNCGRRPRMNPFPRLKRLLVFTTKSIHIVHPLPPLSFTCILHRLLY